MMRLAVLVALCSAAAASAAPPPRDAVRRPTVALTGPLAGLRFGMTRAEVEQLKPELRDRDGKLRLHYGSLRPGEHSSSSNDPKQQVLDLVLLTFPRGEAERVARAAWGAPKVGERFGHKVLFWHNARARLRAMLILDHFFPEDSIQIQPSTTLAELIGAGKGLPFGFERTPLLGKTRAELRAAFGDDLRETDHEHYAQIHVPVADEIDTAVVSLELRDGKVAAYELHLGANGARDGDARLEKLLVHKLGPARHVAGGGWQPGRAETVLEFPDEPRVQARSAGKRQWVIRVQPR